MAKKKLLIVIGAAGMLSGCATTVPILPATLSYDRTDCRSIIDTASAKSLVPLKDKEIWSVDGQLDSAGPCLNSGDASVPYLVYELPGDQHAKMIEVGAVLDLARVVSPKVKLLDANGAETRVFARDQYMFRPGLLSVQFVPQPNERYVLVTVDPEPVGRSHDTIVSSTDTTTIYTGFGASNWRSGNETMMSRGFSYEGPVRVLVYRPDEKD